MSECTTGVSREASQDGRRQMIGLLFPRRSTIPSIFRQFSRYPMNKFPPLFRCAMSLLCAFLVIKWVPVWAHHSVAEFDMNQNLTIRGVVKEVWYNNPHVRYYLTV